MLVKGTVVKTYPAIEEPSVGFGGVVSLKGVPKRDTRWTGGRIPGIG